MNLRLATAAIVLAIAGHAFADMPIYNNVTTTNWSGYGATAPAGPHAFTSVSGSWIVPTISPTPNDTYSGIWVGLDGLSNQTVEQIGILANYFAGNPQYYAFYELYPAASVPIVNIGGIPFTISPGDSMSARVAYAGNISGSDQYTMTLTDNTTGLSYSNTNSTAATDQRSSAEWIVERPTVGAGLPPLASFGSLTFTNAVAALDGGLDSSITSFPNSGIDMVRPSGVPVAFASPLDATGTSFTVTPAPEPSSIAFAAAFGLLLRRRRR